MSGILAIVGRPNVGKSALFNRIAGRRIAIVHDQPGVTRDRVTAEVEYRGHPFTVIDTGGIGLRRGEKGADVITLAALDQANLAIEAAHAIILVVNVQEGLVPLDEEVAARLREAGKPVLLAVNKADNETVAGNAVDFSSLGFDRVYPVSAIHGRGIEALVRAGVALLPEPEREREKVERAPGSGAETAEAEEGGAVAETGEEGEEAEGYGDGRRRRRSRREGAPPPRDFSREPLRLAIVGRPNVGKSSLINAITQSTRVVVSPVPGTTRDAVDVPFEVTTEGRKEKYVLVDTAGVRKKRSIDSSIEFFSVKRTEEAIGRSDITVLVLDAADGILEQDKKIGALITEARRACIVVVNKWDLVAEKVHEVRVAEIERREKRSKPSHDARHMTTLGEFGQWVQEKLFFLDYAPVIFTSAESGFHLDRLLEAVRYVADQLRQAIPTAVLNRTLRDAVERRQPVSAHGNLLRFYYATQIGQAPPKFLLFFNRGDLMNRAYEKYLIDQLRTAFGFEGCPIVLIPRERPKTIESVRKPDRPRGGSGGGGSRGGNRGGNRGPIRSGTKSAEGFGGKGAGKGLRRGPGKAAGTGPGFRKGPPRGGSTGGKPVRKGPAKPGATGGRGTARGRR